MKLKQVIADKNSIGQQWAGIPGIEITPGGRVFVVWYSGGEDEPDDENTIYMCTGNDGGRSFSKAVKMAEPRDGFRAFDPALWIAPGGSLWLIFNRGHKDKGKCAVYGRVCREPDGKQAWSDEFRIGYDVPFSVRLNKPTVISGGGWLMPVTYFTEPALSWSTKGGQLQGAGISADNGKSWELYGAVEAPPWALENMFVERKDGSVLMLIRTGAKTLWQSISADGGRTWSEGSPTSIANPGSRFCIRKLPDGDWLLINSPLPDRRSRIEAFISKDEGITWSKSLVLDERDNVSYPDAAFGADGTIYAVHDRERKEKGEIILSVFRKEDIL
ncbi:MAG: exo-alpha-sialidase [Candidatus Omnitrophica bacterium]|nr:exo-alpha-sialidase [Candidatus Omnitrophota bacterium]